MQNQILLIARYGAAILFVVLEIICFYLIVNYNQTQKGIYINSTKLFSAYLNRESTEIGDFLKLKDINDSLRIENAHLMQRIINAPELTLTVDPKIDADSSLINYFIIPSAICNKTLHLRNNHITLCKGSDDAITKDMGVVTTDGLVGIIKNTSPHFSQVMSLLNSDVRVSAQIGSTGFHGNLVWKSTNTSILNLEAIPKHADIQVGDTILTSGYSTIFPKDLHIGIIDNVDILSGDDNYTIGVKVNTNFEDLNTVYVLGNRRGKEQRALEQ